MTPKGAKAALAYLAEAWASGAPLRELPAEGRPKTLAQAYRLQDMLTAELGFDVAGWKVGATGAAARKLLKARGPFAGRVFAGRVFDSGIVLPGSIYRVRGLEAEFAFRLKTALPARRRAYTRAELMKAIDVMIPAIEIVDSRYEDFRAAGLPSMVADQGMNAALVLGKPVKRWQAIDFKAHEVRMTVNGKTVGEGKGADVMGSPLAALLWLVNHARQHGGLATGQIVTTGTCTGLYRAQPDDAAVAAFGRLGKVAVTFAP